jgi:hypothetical protein
MDDERMSVGEGRKQFFFEKKNQKTFDCLVCTELQRSLQVAKVFWFFFSKKNYFLSV